MLLKSFISNPAILIQDKKSSSPDEGVVEDEEVETELKNGHATDNELTKRKIKKTSKCHILIYLLKPWLTINAKNS